MLLYNRENYIQYPTINHNGREYKKRIYVSLNHLALQQKSNCKLTMLLLLSCFSQVQLCDPMDCSLPGLYVHGDSPGKNTRICCHALFQGSSQPRDQTRVFCNAGRFFTTELVYFNLKMLIEKNWPISWVVFHCIYVPHLPYAFLCQWIFRLLPCLGYCK